MADETDRAVYIQRIDPDQHEEYLEAHEDVPEGVTEAMRRGGATELELYLRDDIAICVLECDDLDAYLETVDGDEAVEEWERFTGQFKREGVDIDAEEPIPFMERIWSLSDTDQ